LELRARFVDVRVDADDVDGLPFGKGAADGVDVERRVDRYECAGEKAHASYLRTESMVAVSGCVGLAPEDGRITNQSCVLSAAYANAAASLSSLMRRIRLPEGPESPLMFALLTLPGTAITNTFWRKSFTSDCPLVPRAPSPT